MNRSDKGGTTAAILSLRKAIISSFLPLALFMVNLFIFSQALAVSFNAAQMYGLGANPYSVTTGDFNGDGKLDRLDRRCGLRYRSELTGVFGTFRAHEIAIDN